MAEDLTAFLQRLERHASTRLVAPDVGQKSDETVKHLAASSFPRHVHASGENSPSDVAMKRDGKRDTAVTLPVPPLTEVFAHLMGVERDQVAAEAAGGDTELDRDGARNGLPVVLAGDLERLRDFDDRRLNDLLDVLIHLPGARIAELSRRRPRDARERLARPREETRNG